MTKIEQVEQIVQRVAGGWRGAPRLTVVKSPSALPIKAPDDARGLYWRGEAYIVGDQPLHMVGPTVVHEVVAHHATRKLLGPRWPSFIVAVNAGTRSDMSLAAMRAQGRAAICRLRPCARRCATTTVSFQR